MKVYVAHEGEYSGRFATGVFTDKALAERFSDDVEEFELDGGEDTIQRYKNGYKHWFVTVYKTTTAQESTPRPSIDVSFWPRGEYWVSGVWAKTKDQAAKIAQDEVAKCIATYGDEIKWSTDHRWGWTLLGRDGWLAEKERYARALTPR